jgi:hypothetical protein
MPRIVPEARYFSMPSTDVGSEVLRNRARNCWPWVRSLTQSPHAVIHSPADIVAPTTVTRSRWLRALTRMTQKPFSAFWLVEAVVHHSNSSARNDAMGQSLHVPDARPRRLCSC